MKEGEKEAPIVLKDLILEFNPATLEYDISDFIRPDDSPEIIVCKIGIIAAFDKEMKGWELYISENLLYNTRISFSIDLAPNQGIRRKGVVS